MGAGVLVLIRPPFIRPIRPIRPIAHGLRCSDGGEPCAPLGPDGTVVAPLEGVGAFDELGAQVARGGADAEIVFAVAVEVASTDDGENCQKGDPAAHRGGVAS